ncbi:hypothetical protein RhiirC2_797184 [Rhizophagus irregularis]|uniref:Uncharacterized protein n=1 Tax=Rhizophagus irregularis TaxID=588596 RepID=A0A2N1M8F1_9GLOM|nr:hypothetical protein RhiirC2_797184 [Rhizophagus irregularis]
MPSILTPSFHVYYSKQLNQLPHSIKIDTWQHLTSRKRPLSIEQASSIHPESREVAMTRSLEESAIALAEKSIDMLENKCRQLEDIISAKDRKIIALVDQILSKTKHNDVTIEPEIYSTTHERKLWAKRRSESEYDLEVQKKYTFRDLVGK